MIKYIMKNRILICCTALLCLLLVSVQPARAGEEDEGSIFDDTALMFLGEELYTVTIASRKAEPLQRAPAAVTVIQGEELKRYRTLSEVLRRVPGFFIDRNISDIFIY